MFALVRTAWKAKGTVISTEMRAFNNHYGKRGLGHYTGIAGFGKHPTNVMQHTARVLAPTHTSSALIELHAMLKGSVKRSVAAWKLYSVRCI